MPGGVGGDRSGTLIAPIPISLNVFIDVSQFSVPLKIHILELMGSIGAGVE